MGISDGGGEDLKLVIMASEIKGVIRNGISNGIKLGLIVIKVKV